MVDDRLTFYLKEWPPIIYEIAIDKPIKRSSLLLFCRKTNAVSPVNKAVKNEDQKIHYYQSLTIAKMLKSLDRFV